MKAEKCFISVFILLLGAGCRTAVSPVDSASKPVFTEEVAVRMLTANVNALTRANEFNAAIYLLENQALFIDNLGLLDGHLAAYRDGFLIFTSATCYYALGQEDKSLEYMKKCYWNSVGNWDMKAKKWMDKLEKSKKEK